MEEALIIFMYGLQRRKAFATVKNTESSRSHTVFQVKLCTGSKVMAKFSLVDLAGSERLSEGEKTQERIEEAKYINKSLSALGNVIAALRHPCHVPYRDSKLTHILKDSLGGNSLTHVITTISPSGQCLQETLSSMKFANNAKSVKQHLKENVALLELK